MGGCPSTHFEQQPFGGLEEADDLLREGRPGSAVLIYDNLPPAALQLRPWYADRHLKRLATTSR